MEEPTRRQTVQQLHEAVSPQYAIFLRSPSGLRAHFKYLHDSLESAIEGCRSMAAERAASGQVDYTYYAVEIKHRVGIERGKIVDEPTK